MGSCSCCRLVQRRVRGGKREVGEIHAHLWWAVISWPCNGALVFLHHWKEKDSDSSQSIEGGGWIQGRLVLHSQPAGCWCVLQLQRNLSLSSLCVCVCVGLKCLPSSFHCCSPGCSQGCVAWLWETQPLSRLLSWYYTKGVVLGLWPVEDLNPASIFWAQSLDVSSL